MRGCPYWGTPSLWVTPLGLLGRKVPYLVHMVQRHPPAPARILTAMPLPVIANVTRAAVRGVTAHGTPWVNVWHFSHSAGAPTLANYQAFAAEIDKLYGAGAPYAGGVGLINSAKTTTLCREVVFTELDGITPSVTVALTAAGGSGGSSLPAEVAEVFTLRTSNRGRRYRGRIYLPCYSVTNINADGTLVSALATSIPAQFNGFVAAAVLLAKAWVPVVASYVGGFATPIQSTSFNLDTDHQRRRKS